MFSTPTTYEALSAHNNCNENKLTTTALKPLIRFIFTFQTSLFGHTYKLRLKNDFELIAYRHFTLLEQIQAP